MIILAIKFCRHDELKEEPAGHSQYKPGLSTRREHNAQRSYIGHAQRSNFERPRLNVERRPSREATVFTQIYGKGKLETFRTYSFIDCRFPVDLLLFFEL